MNGVIKKKFRFMFRVWKLRAIKLIVKRLEFLCNIKNENTSLSNEEIEKLNNIVEQLEDNKEIIKCATIINSVKIDEINEKIKTIVDNATTQFEKIKNKLEQLKLTHKIKEYDYVDRIIGISNKHHDRISEFLKRKYNN